MSSLLYHPGWREARQRMAAWWNGEDISRAAMHIRVPRPEPIEGIEVMPEPEGWVTDLSTKSLEYRVNLALRTCANYCYFGELAPWAAPGDLAPNCLALYLGCRGVEMPGTVWCQPCIVHPEQARFDYDPGNFYWRFTVEAYSQSLELGRGKFLHHFPDLIEGLDTLAAMRGNQQLLVDLVDRPEWVFDCLRQITQAYFHYYDILYDLLRDEVGGSVFWAWAPGRLSKLQCDMSAMICKGMFWDFMVPVLREMTERVSYSMYHWDGPGALQHLDALLSLPRLTMIQWTPGCGAEPYWHQRWWPYYHRILDAGKKLSIIWVENTEQLLTLKREFGDQSKNMLIGMEADSPGQAQDFLHAVEL